MRLSRRAKKRAYNQAWRAAHPTYDCDYRDTQRGHHPPQLACCGEWHAVTQIPLTTPCCGKRYLEETR